MEVWKESCPTIDEGDLEGFDVTECCLRRTSPHFLNVFYVVLPWVFTPFSLLLAMSLGIPQFRPISSFILGWITFSLASPALRYS